MVNYKTLEDCFINDARLIGWQKGFDPNDPTLDSDLLTSQSGLYYNLSNPLLTLANLASIAPDFDRFNWIPYEALDSYMVGDIIIYLGVNYKSLVNSNVGNTPDLSPTEWEIFNPLSDWLRKQEKNALNTVLNNTFLQKRLKRNAKTLLENTYLFNSDGGANNQTEATQGRFVGITINQMPKDGIVSIINRIGFQFFQAETFNLYIYHSSQEQAISIIPISVNSPNSFEWVKVDDVILRYMNDNGYQSNTKGSFKIGYFESEISGSIVNYPFDGTGKNYCRSCGKGRIDYSHFRDWSKYIKAYVFSVSPTNLNGVDLWQVENEQIQTNKSFGMNLQLSVRCDLTDLVCRNKDLMTNALLMQVQRDLLHGLVSSTRSNDIKEETKRDAFYALQGDNQSGVEGLETKLTKELEGVDFDFSDLSSPCAPCNKKANGVIYGAA